MNSYVLIAFFTFFTVIGIASSAGFSIEPLNLVNLAPPSSFSSVSGRSEADCALQCAAESPCYCTATAFISDSRLCLFFVDGQVRGLPGTSMGTVSIYRRLLTQVDVDSCLPPWRKSFANIGDRRFQIIQQRSKGELSFARTWTEYENGFGDDTDLWIGLQAIHELTAETPRLLRVEAISSADTLFVSEYSGFNVTDASTNYAMAYDSYLTGSSNMTGDSLDIHKGMKFSTMDRDNDRSPNSCSQTRGHVGWWFNACLKSNPNGVYHEYNGSIYARMVWYDAAGWNPLKAIRIMLLV